MSSNSHALRARLLLAVGVSLAGEACGGQVADVGQTQGQGGTSGGGSPGAGGSDGGTSAGVGGATTIGAGGSTTTGAGGDGAGGSGTGGTWTTSPVPCGAGGACVANETCGSSGNVCHCDAGGSFHCVAALPFGTKPLVCIDGASGVCPSASAAFMAVMKRFSAPCLYYDPQQTPALEKASDGTPACCYVTSLSGCTGRPLEVDDELRVARLVRRAAWAA